METTINEDNKISKTMARLKKILVDRGEVQRIAILFNVSAQTIRNALKFITEGDEPDRYRKEAVKGGGVVISRKIRMPKVN